MHKQKKREACFRKTKEKCQFGMQEFLRNHIRIFTQINKLHMKNTEIENNSHASKQGLKNFFSCSFGEYTNMQLKNDISRKYRLGFGNQTQKCTNLFSTFQNIAS